MAYEGDPQMIDLRRGCKLPGTRNLCRPSRSFTLQSPAKHITQAFVGLRQPGVIKPLSIKMIGDRAAVVSIPQRAFPPSQPFQQLRSAQLPARSCDQVAGEAPGLFNKVPSDPEAGRVKDANDPNPPGQPDVNRAPQLRGLRRNACGFHLPTHA